VIQQLRYHFSTGTNKYNLLAIVTKSPLLSQRGLKECLAEVLVLCLFLRVFGIAAQMLENGSNKPGD
jgi:hypothetical protein